MFVVQPFRTAVITDDPELRVQAIRTVLRYCLGALWLLDAVLQAQPLMYSYSFVSSIMTPALKLNPGFVWKLSEWTVSFINRNVGMWNWVFVIMQLTIALTLLTRRPRIVRTGLVVSIAWSLGVWVFGEGMGGVFTTAATLLTGAPGAVILYAAIAIFLLMPVSWWRLDSAVSVPRDMIVLLLFWGAFIQGNPAFWQTGGLSELLVGNAYMQPGVLQQSILWFVPFVEHNRIVINSLFILVMLVIGILLFGPKPHMTGYWILGTFLLLIWWEFQAFGMVFAGMGTDLNTPPLLALLALPGFVLMLHARRSHTAEVAVRGERRRIQNEAGIH
ncbi:MAG: hypothetical protein ACP5OR_06670 [Candidatus Dormibacteria bacterium]